METAHVPSGWSRLRVVAIPKPKGGTRPIAVSSVMWRIGARIMAKACYSTTPCWMDAELLGGLPTRGIAIAHSLLHHSITTAHSEDKELTIKPPHACTPD